MRKICTLIVFLSAVISVWAGGQAEGAATAGSSKPADTITVTDCMGRDVSIPDNPESFVAIGPGCLRLYCYIGDVGKVAGIEQLEVKNGPVGRPYIKANPQLLDLPIIGPGGPGNAPDPEKILEVLPDVIFTLYNSDASSVEELQHKTGIPVVALSYGETEVFDPMLKRSLELIGKITGNEARAEEVIGFIDSCSNDLQSRTEDIAAADKPGIYFGAMSMRGAHGIESTRGNYSLFQAVNARNVVEEAGIKTYVMLDKEKLLDMDPEIIILDAGGLANVREDYSANLQFYNGLRAFKNGQVYMQLPYNYYYTNIDIALCDAYFIGTVLYPDRFDDMDIAEKSDEIFQKFLGKKLYSQVASEYYGGYQKLTF